MHENVTLIHWQFMNILEYIFILLYKKLSLYHDLIYLFETRCSAMARQRINANDFNAI
jgi:hypothetical protein